MGGFKIYPGVTYTEEDLTLGISSATGTAGAMAGHFEWGAADVTTYITSGKDGLVKKFYKPTNENYLSFMMAMDFLQYTSGVYINRVVGDAARNAVKKDGTPVLVKNPKEYDTKKSSIGSDFFARYPGSLGNGITVDVADAIKYENWEYKSQFSYKPQMGEYHIAVVDGSGKFTGLGARGQKEKFTVSGSPEEGVNQVEKYTIIPDIIAEGGVGQAEKITITHSGVGATADGEITLTQANSGMRQVEKLTFTGISATSDGSVSVILDPKIAVRQVETVTISGTAGSDNFIAFTVGSSTINVPFLSGETASQVANKVRVKFIESGEFYSVEVSGVDVIATYLTEGQYSPIVDNEPGAGITSSSIITVEGLSNIIDFNIASGDTLSEIAVKGAAAIVLHPDIDSAINDGGSINITYGEDERYDVPISMIGGTSLSIGSLTKVSVIGISSTVNIPFSMGDKSVDIATRIYDEFLLRPDYDVYYDLGDSSLIVTNKNYGIQESMSAVSSAGINLVIQVTIPGSLQFVVPFDGVDCLITNGQNTVAIAEAMAESLDLSGNYKSIEYTPGDDFFQLTHLYPTEQRVTLPIIYPTVGNVKLAGGASAPSVVVAGDPIKDGYVISGGSTEITTSLKYGDTPTMSAVRIGVAMKDSGIYESVSVSGNVITANRKESGNITVSAPTLGSFGIDIITEVLSAGTYGEIMERYENMTTVPGSKKDDGTNAYYLDVINAGSNYVYVGQGRDLALINDTFVMEGGVSDNSKSLISAIDSFSDANNVGAKFLFGAKTTQEQQKIIDVSYARRDLIAFNSPMIDDVTLGDPTENCIEWRNVQVNRATSYEVYDCNWGLLYDEYNDTDRWVPCSSGTAGIMARMYGLGDAGKSPADPDYSSYLGYSELAWSPDETAGGELYINDINAITSNPGEGIRLFGDKTGLGKKSAFNRINTRSAFIEIEVAIAKMSRLYLFKFNTPFTQSQMLNAGRPYLRGKVNAGIIEDGKMIVDERNNTADVIMDNTMAGDILIKPMYSINYITLKFSAVGTGVDFTEIESAKFGS